MSGRRCVCCDLPVEWCGRAAERRQQAEEQAEFTAVRARPGVIEASWTTRCVLCVGLIRPGQLIRPHPVGRDGLLWVHAWEGDCG